MPMPTTATAMALVATTVATDHMVSDTAMASTTARGRLRLSPRLMPITDTEATDLADSTVATGLTVSDMATVSTTTARRRLRTWRTLRWLQVLRSRIWPRCLPLRQDGGYGLGGLYGGYRSYGLGYGHGVYHYGKREAEPYYGVYSAHHAVAPVVSYAHHAVAAPVVSHAVHA